MNLNIKKLIVFLVILVFLPLTGTASQAVSPLTTEGFVAALRTDIIKSYQASAENVVVEWKDEDLAKKIAEIKKVYPGKEITVKVKDFVISTISGKEGLPVDVYVDGKLNRMIYVKCKVDVLKEVLVATEKIKRGEAFTDANVKFVKLPVNKILSSSNSLVDLSAVKGKIAVSDIQENAVITSQLLKEKTVIFRGNQVTIRIVNGGLTLTGVGQALQDGYLGQNITVKVTSFTNQKTLLAKVLDYDLVEVNLGSNSQ